MNGPNSVKIVSWNVAHRREPWHCLLDMDADVALLQEAGKPPPDVAARIEIDPAPWRTARFQQPWRTAVIKLSDRVRVDWIEIKAIDQARSGELPVSQLGTLAVATVTPPRGEPFVMASMYAQWERPHDADWIYADSSAHRIVSDLSALLASDHDHRVIAAGDLNILHGHGEHGNAHWATRYQTVFTRMEALGLPFVGPQAPNGRQADPWPDELPRESRNVPTYHTVKQRPAAARRQLDFVFASRSLVGSVRVRALNEPDQWGPSDHCRLLIEVA